MEIMSLGFYSKVIYYLRARSRVTRNACNTRKCNISCQKESDHILDHFIRDNFWMKYWISESTGSDGESANLHPVTRLASDLGRMRQKYHRTVQKYVCTVQYLDGLRQQLK
jgi:hypothetical protein